MSVISINPVGFQAQLQRDIELRDKLEKDLGLQKHLVARLIEQVLGDSSGELATRYFSQSTGQLLKSMTDVENGGFAVFFRPKGTPDVSDSYKSQHAITVVFFAVNSILAGHHSLSDSDQSFLQNLIDAGNGEFQSQFGTMSASFASRGFNTRNSQYANFAEVTGDSFLEMLTNVNSRLALENRLNLAVEIAAYESQQKGSKTGRIGRGQ